MHYYQHNIKDFNNATRHLTRVERCLYRDSIELYYDTELPLSSDLKVLSRKLLCTSDDEKEALKYILSEFFYKVDNLYHHTRCDFEIDKFHNTVSAKARAGKASADARRKKKESKIEQKGTGVEQVLNCVEPLFEQNPTNQQPLTINQQPLTKDIKDLSPTVSKPTKKKFCAIEFSQESINNCQINQPAWKEWVTFRRVDKKKSISKAAAVKQLNILSEFDFPTQQQIIDQSITNDYQGLFPVKQNQQQVAKPKDEMFKQTMSIRDF